MSALTTATPLTGLTARFSARVSSRGRRSVVVAARGHLAHDGQAMNRRAAASLLILPASLMLPKSSWALIPDDDDEELVQKAKANRKSRLLQDKAQDKEFINQEGLKTAQQTTDIVPVQKAIAALAKSGSELESGDIGAVASTMGGSWVKEFKAAALDLSNTEASKSSAQAVFGHLEMLQKSAKAKNLSDAKGHFVSLVDSLQTWVADAGVEGKLKGL